MNKFQNMNKRKLLGIAAIVMAAFLIIVFASFFLKNNEESPDKEIQGADGNVTEEVSPTPEELDQSPVPEGEGVIGEADVDRDSIDIDVRLLPEMEEEIPDLDAMKKAIVDYIVENDLWVGVTRAQTDFVITKDYNKNTVQLEFVLDDKSQTRIIVHINRAKGNITLNHY